MKFLAAIPYLVLIPIAVLMALAPFGLTPHLVEKWRMLPRAFPEKYVAAMRRAIDHGAVKRQLLEPPAFEVSLNQAHG